MSLAPVKGTPLKRVWLDFKRGRDTEIMRSITTLETFTFKTAKEFLR